jgi:DNA-binding NarL/FixJ family response regulator
MAPLTAVVVDDNSYFSRFVTQLIADHYADLLDVRAACGTHSAVDQCVALQPQIILLDLGLPGMTNLPLIGRLRQAAPAAAIVVLSTEDEAPYVEAARRAGAETLIGKGALNGALRATIAHLYPAQPGDPGRREPASRLPTAYGAP